MSTIPEILSQNSAYRLDDSSTGFARTGAEPTSPLTNGSSGPVHALPLLNLEASLGVHGPLSLDR